MVDARSASTPLRTTARPEARTLDAALVTATVYDSLAERPLPGAHVQIVRVGTPNRVYDTTADSLGRFTLTDVDGGTYDVGFFHPRIDSLGIDIPAQRITLSPAGRADVQLATPSRATVLSAACPDSARREDATLLMGMVRSAESGAPMSGAVVSVPWSGLAFGDSGGLSAVRQGAMTPASPEGRFAICNVPAGAGLTMRGWEWAARTDSSGRFAFAPVPAAGRRRST
jgi:hypothetical protein